MNTLRLPVARSVALIEEALQATIGRAGNVDLVIVDGETIARIIDFTTDSPARNGFAYGELNLSRIARDMERFLS
ncbi:hypothetical protein [Phyllobacterium leguminum]|uniref:Uncharacterized protein n=1 Tax=Phyllobacterium leguminum TaxID=314237 RepID=A0A318TEM3_9HYPH|nr:hypothetical protein [Phyllobacterium leguminum]PYE86889.1 hypothetical protein C7477_11827 [Phyllobacterium leguminum]